MSENGTSRSRRRFLRSALTGLAAAPLGGLAGYRLAHAADKPKVSPDDPQAKALKYTHDASTVESDLRQKGADCANCQLYTGDPESEWGPCTLFQNKLVNANGWCTGWAKKTG